MQYQLGQTYQYSVRSWTEARNLFLVNTQSEDVEQQHLTEKLIGLEAQALLTPTTECEISLQLKNVKLHLKQGSSRFNQEQTQQDVAKFTEMLQVPVLFGYERGVVTELCVDTHQEDQFALNLKKSIISTLQTIPGLKSDIASAHFKVCSEFHVPYSYLTF